MTEHEDFIKTLKVGSRVAIKNRPIGGFFSKDRGWRLHTVTHITPRRTRFDLSSTGSGVTTSVTANSVCDMQPVTPEIFDAMAGDSNRERARDKALKVRATLESALGRSVAVDFTDIEPHLDALMKFLDSKKE